MEVTLWLTVNIRSGCTLTTDKTVGSPRARALVLPCGGHVLSLLGMWGIARDWVSSRFSPFKTGRCVHATAYSGLFWRGLNVQSGHSKCQNYGASCAPLGPGLLKR